MEPLWRDVRIAIRGLRRSPGFAAVAVLTLALGSGATTAVFSVVYGVLLRPLPFPAADRFVEIVQVIPERQTGGTYRAGVTPGDVTTFSIAASLLLMTAVAACLVPSIRATRVDPVVALRAE